MIQGILKHAWTKGKAAYMATMKHFVGENKLAHVVQQSIYNMAVVTGAVEIILLSKTSFLYSHVMFNTCLHS